jgi:hypothetical protein
VEHREVEVMRIETIQVIIQDRPDILEEDPREEATSSDLEVAEEIENSHLDSEEEPEELKEDTTVIMGNLKVLQKLDPSIQEEEEEEEAEAEDSESTDPNSTMLNPEITPRIIKKYLQNISYGFKFSNLNIIFYFV